MLRVKVIDSSPIMSCTALLSEAAVLQETTAYWEWRGGDDVVMMMICGRLYFIHLTFFLPYSLYSRYFLPSFYQNRRSGVWLKSCVLCEYIFIFTCV
jgi:hypothetical protein